MNAHARQALYRSSDGELLGHVERRGERWLALSVFGIPMASCETEGEAESWLLGRGLAALGEAWDFYDSELEAWYACQLEEASPKSVSLRVVELGHPRAYTQIRLNNPDETRIRFRRLTANTGEIKHI